ncbi:hypothetical protein [Pinibacter soli]|uniref:hypothetical protein n=1 Tax=Pinibacter soli TaxID=3044211 RepID=UPI00249CE522|nr:hypothetical protein [Pinibacter soli]
MESDSARTMEYLPDESVVVPRPDLDNTLTPGIGNVLVSSIIVPFMVAYCAVAATVQKQTTISSKYLIR